MFACQGNTNYWEFKRSSLKATLVAIFLHIFLDSSAVIGIWSLSNSFIISFKKLSRWDFCFIAQIYVSHYKIFSQYFGFSHSQYMKIALSILSFLLSVLQNSKVCLAVLSNNLPQFLCFMIYGLIGLTTYAVLCFFFHFCCLLSFLEMLKNKIVPNISSILIFIGIFLQSLLSIALRALHLSVKWSTAEEHTHPFLRW